MRPDPKWGSITKRNHALMSITLLLHYSRYAQRKAVWYLKANRLVPSLHYKGMAVAYRHSAETFATWNKINWWMPDRLR
jgi:hypothetical protein